MDDKAERARRESVDDDHMSKKNHPPILGEGCSGSDGSEGRAAESYLGTAETRAVLGTTNGHDVRDAAAGQASNAPAAAMGSKGDDESSLLDEKRRWLSRGSVSSSNLRRSSLDSSTMTRTLSRNTEDSDKKRRRSPRKKARVGRKFVDTKPAGRTIPLKLDTNLKESPPDRKVAEGMLSLELDTDVVEPPPQTCDDDAGGAIVRHTPQQLDGTISSAPQGDGESDDGPGAYAITGVPLRNTTPERRVSSDRVIQVEATLVHDEEQEYNDRGDDDAERRTSGEDDNHGHAAKDSSVTVVTAQRIGKRAVVVDLQNTRVRWGLCVLIAVFASFAAGLGVALSRQENHEVSDEEAQDHSTFVPSSLRPTAWPTPSPSYLPMPSSWKLMGPHIDSIEIGGEFGSRVSLSDNGNILAASFRRIRQFSGAFYETSTARVYFYTEIENDNGEGRWRRAEADFYPSCQDWSSASVAVSGNGKTVATATRGCGTIEVTLFVNLEDTANEVERIPSTNSTDPSDDRTQHDVTLLRLGVYGVADTAQASQIPLTLRLSEEGNVIAITNNTHVLMSRNAGSIDDESAPLVQIVEGGDVMSMSGDGDMIGVDSFLFTNSTSETFGVKIYGYDQELDSWGQIGSAIGHTADVRSTAMSVDGTIVAVGASDWDAAPLVFPCSTCGPDPGRVSIYRLRDGSWMPMGDVLRGEDDGDRFGQSVSLSKDGLMLAVGASGSNAGGRGNGLTRVYRYEESEVESGKWVQVSSDIQGEFSGEQSGWAVALSGDGTRVAVSAPKNWEGGYDAGRVSVFELS